MHYSLMILLHSFRLLLGCAVRGGPIRADGGLVRETILHHVVQPLIHGELMEQFFNTSPCEVAIIFVINFALSPFLPVCMYENARTCELVVLSVFLCGISLRCWICLWQ